MVLISCCSCPMHLSLSAITLCKSAICFSYLAGLGSWNNAPILSTAFVVASTATPFSLSVLISRRVCANSVSAPQPQPGRPDELLYDPDETAQMIRHLTDGYFDPEYVLLFGKLAGGTPHSNDLLEQAQDAFAGGRNVRLAAQFSAQAIVYFYHTLYYVYHGMEFDIHDPVVMHDRMRTLSTKLMLVFDDNHIENIFTLPWLKQILMKTPYSAEFYMAPQELEMHMGRVQKAAEIIENYCGLRLELYKELGTQ